MTIERSFIGPGSFSVYLLLYRFSGCGERSLALGERASRPLWDRRRRQDEHELELARYALCMQQHQQKLP